MRFGTHRVCVLALASLGAATALAWTHGEQRLQAVLKLDGDFLDEGGFKISVVVDGGPCTRLEHTTDPNTQGILEVGDTILRVGGRSFVGRREFLDLLNATHRDNDGKAVITVRDVNTGDIMDWIARPEVVEMEVPDAEIDLAKELGDAIESAPNPPAIPAVIDL